MAEHVRRCVKCQAGFPCSGMDALIEQMTDLEVIEAASQVTKDRRHTLMDQRRYQREYMRKWRKTHSQSAKGKP